MERILVGIPASPGMVVGPAHVLLWEVPPVRLRLVPPEQIEGKPVDGRADVYSLGCVLYRCLCGSVPFPGLTEVATIYSHLRDPPPSLLGAAEAWTGVDRVLAKALSKDKHVQDEIPMSLNLADAQRMVDEVERDAGIQR